MRELMGNLFDCIGHVDAICITTNGYVKRNGEAVMGKGCAKEATKRWPNIAKDLGQRLQTDGNVVHLLDREQDTWICSFPVKPVYDIFDGTNAVMHMVSKFQIGDKVPGWACVANLERIEASAIQLQQLARKHQWQRVILPRPGCGAGERMWVEVKSVLEKHLDDRFAAITFG